MSDFCSSVSLFFCFSVLMYNCWALKVDSKDGC